jgi:uncharacterized protein DUF5681
MANKPVGYCNPPDATKFKRGVSGNPKGRPKRQPTPLGEIIRNALNSPVRYLEKGRAKTTTLRELTLKLLTERAAKGDLTAAEHVLKLRAQAKRDGEIGIETLRITDWLPDWDGQTGEQKTLESEASRPLGRDERRS